MEKRSAERFDKVFPVSIESSIFGACHGIARNISAGGMFVEMADPLPLGSHVRVHFTVPDSSTELVARGEVKRHYFLHFTDAGGPRAMTGMGVRFTGFDDGLKDDLGVAIAGLRATLH